jgi:glycosyltransferase involved in cell wall biosynthesis
MLRADDQQPVWLYDPFCFTPWYTAELAMALGKAGTKVRLLCGTLEREPDYFHRQGLEPEIGLLGLTWLQPSAPRPLTRLMRFGQALSTIRALKRYLRQEIAPRPKLLHLQQLPMLNHGLRADFGLIEEAQKTGVPVLHTVHNVLPHQGAERTRAIYGELYQRVDHLICHSEHARERLSNEFGVSSNKISLIPHGPLFSSASLDPVEDKIAARQRLAIPAESAVVLCQGILADYKGVDVLLEAWMESIHKGANPATSPPLLVIAGAGSTQIEAIVRQAAQSMNTSVRAELRYISTEELPSFYNAADILVYPYRAITTSGALLTGLSYRKPIIASKLSPFLDYLEEGNNALLVETGNASELGEALRSLLFGMAALRDKRPSPAANTYSRLVDGAASNRGRYVGWDAIAGLTGGLYERMSGTAPVAVAEVCNLVHTKSQAS